jgi:hypothetical protein
VCEIDAREAFSDELEAGASLEECADHADVGLYDCRHRCELDGKL